MTLAEYKEACEKRLEINIKHMERGVRFADINTASESIISTMQAFNIIPDDQDRKRHIKLLYLFL